MSAAAAYQAQRTLNAATLGRLACPPAYTPPPRPQHAQESPVQPAPVHRDPSAFQAGADAAYDRVLAFLDALPESLATSTRDKGRGAAHAVAEIRQAVLTLRDDR